ncbi:MAG TPA: hypothetical protein VNK24_01385 [Elusimicrobiota bacterium]|nr:hypothetical protein [Elusimicrobiota bacterium]
MLKRLLTVLAAVGLFGTVVYAQAPTPAPQSCNGLEITSVHHTLCAKLESFSITIPAGPGSQLAQMHKQLGPVIDQKFIVARKEGKNGVIPRGVDAAIRQLTVFGRPYECRKAEIKSHALLIMRDCRLQKMSHAGKKMGPR